MDTYNLRFPIVGAHQDRYEHSLDALNKFAIFQSCTNLSLPIYLTLHFILKPLLVPAAYGRIQFDRRFIQKDHFQELSQFSHIFVIFVFHENTNIDSVIKLEDAEGLTTAQSSVTRMPTAKIAPPRLGGKKVGCLSTRSPHRPNPIGLSVCEIVQVGDDYIDIKSIDFVDGTPVLDVKPYIPYDVVKLPNDAHFASSQKAAEKILCNDQHALGQYLPMARTVEGEDLQTNVLKVPDWIREPDVPMRLVQFTDEAVAAINDLCPTIDDDQQRVEKFNRSGKCSKNRFCKNALHAQHLITQVLRQDIRGVRQGRNTTSIKDIDTNTNHVTVSKEESGQEYMVRLDAMVIDVCFYNDKVVVNRVSPAQPHLSPDATS